MVYNRVLSEGAVAQFAAGWTRNTMYCMLTGLALNGWHKGHVALAVQVLALVPHQEFPYRLLDFPKEVPFSEWKWPCPFKDKIYAWCWQLTLSCFAFQIITIPVRESGDNTEGFRDFKFTVQPNSVPAGSSYECIQQFTNRSVQGHNNNRFLI